MLKTWGSALLWGIVGFFLCGPWTSAQAQIDVPDIQRLSPSSQVEAGIRSLRAGNPGKAITMLQPAFQADSALTVPSHGAVAYWLGEAYDRADQPQKAQATWRTGLRALRSAGKFDVRLADTYLRTLPPKQLRGERLYAVDVYESLLRRVGTDTSAVAQSIFRRRIAQIATLMPDNVLDRVVREKRSAGAAQWTFRPEAGTALVEWWRGLDPLPATEANERLEEHLTRLVRAQREYGCRERTSALDRRGIVYLRFGAPYKQRSLSYKDGEFFTEVYRFGVNIPPSSFPRSEIWLYTHIAESGYYLFAEETGSSCYKIARANDLLPSYLTRRQSETKRGINVAYSAMKAMQAIYNQLALYHIDFADRYTEIANYAGWQKMKANISKVKENYGSAAGESSTEVGAGIGQTRKVFENEIIGYGFPNQFVARMVRRAAREDRAAAERRKEAMPRQHTTLLDGSARLPVAMRTARFLNEDGTTRTEIYWGVPTSGLRLFTKEGEATVSIPSMITFSAVRYDDSHESQQRKRRRYEVGLESEESPRAVVPPTITLNGASDVYHLGMQWEQYELWQTDSTTETASLGAKRRIAAARVDSLSPLRAKGPRVEMSDVMVMTHPDTSARTLARPLEQAQPYPFNTLSTDVPLLLSFEVYHLSYGSDDRTRYTVSYEAEGETNRGWTRLFRGQDTQRTTTEMTAEGTSPRTRETILLDLSKLSQGESQNVRVTVQVTDEVTDTTVSRSVNFTLQPKGALN